MKKPLSLVVILATSSLAALAQTVPPAHRPDTTTAVVARHRAEHYKGPKVVADSKELGQKFRRKSKPADRLMRVPVLSSPPK